MYGLGNWAAVGEHCNRAPQQCAAHYEAIYLRSPAFPLATPAPEMAGVRPAPAPLQLLLRSSHRLQAGLSMGGFERHVFVLTAVLTS